MKILLTVAPNGARKTKEDIPSLPLTPEEIGADAKACLEAGAAMIHLHVRNKSGLHSLNTHYYDEAIAQIKAQTEEQMLIQVTSEAVGKYTPEEQFEMIHRLKPEFVSIGLREIKKLDDLDINENFNWMRQNNVAPQLILYNERDLSLYKNWLEEGIIPGEAYPLLLVVGKAHIKDAFERTALDESLKHVASSWMVCAFGDQEFSAGKHSAELGGHIRLGFENNSCLENGEEANSNAELIKQMADYLLKNNHELAKYSDARKIMQPDW